MPVGNFPLSCFVLKLRSGLYLLDNGSIADLVPCCNVAFKVDCALFGPIQNLSASTSPDILEWRLVETNVLGSNKSTPLELSSVVDDSSKQLMSIAYK